VNGTCAAPSTFCNTVNALTGRVDCRFNPKDELMIVQNLDISCSEFEFGPAYGFMDSASTEQWLSNKTTLSTATEDLLRYGRGGVRAIGLDKLTETLP